MNQVQITIQRRGFEMSSRKAITLTQYSFVIERLEYSL